MSRLSSIRYGFLLIGTLLFAAHAVAEELLVFYPASPGRVEQAQPIVDELVAYLGKKADLPSLEGGYAVDWEAGTKRLRADDGPAFAILAPEAYAALASDDVVPLLQAERNGKTTRRYHLLVASKETKLADLAGRTIVSTYLSNLDFAERVLLNGKLQLPEKVRVKVTRRPLTAVRKLVRGDLDAVLVDQEQLALLKRMKSLSPKPHVLHTSHPVPTAPVVAFRSRTTESERKRLTRAFKGMTKDEKGRRLLAVLRTTGFVDSDEKALRQMVDRSRGEESGDETE